MDKLFPPQIEGVIPAFYKIRDNQTNVVTGATIKVPFQMNQAVGYASIDGFALKIKTIQSGETICPVQYTENIDLENGLAIFNLDAINANLFQEGQYYKIQLAYYQIHKELVILSDGTRVEMNSSDPLAKKDIGYYSTVGVIKCVSKPNVYIKGYSIDSINLFAGTFFGVYDQTKSLDQTEKVFSYNFAFYDINDKLYYKTKELIHDASQDIDYTESIDKLVMNDFIKANEVYKIIYTVTTMNGLIISSPKYKVTRQELLAPGKMLKVLPIPNIEEGYIQIKLQGNYITIEDQIKEDNYYGEYIICRASEEDDYREQMQIYNFRLEQEKPSTIHFRDFAVKQGVKYIYSVQQYNIWGLKSSRIESEPVSIDYEDMFLFDGERQLRIRFNPKVSSFRTVVLEQKVETIGNKYPFISRNGRVGYKEFPIEGLISFQIDNAHLFYKREYELFLRRKTNPAELTPEENESVVNYCDLVEDNIHMERDFKLAVLDWVNNGKPKLFKSGPEGTYIVRLLNTMMYPEDTLGRMLHKFRSMAYEIAPFNYESLVKYGFINSSKINKYVSLWKTYNLADSQYTPGQDIEITFEQEVSMFEVNGMLPGNKILLYYEHSLIPDTIVIGVTGSYRFENSSKRVTKIVIPVEENQKICGTIECQYIGQRYSYFDAVKDIKLKTIVSKQFIGVTPDAFNLENTKNIVGIQTGWTDQNVIDLFKQYRQRYILNETKNMTSIVDKLNILQLVENTSSCIPDPNSDFHAGDIIQEIQSEFYNGERKKIFIQNLEQAYLRVRPLIPVYIVPYDYISDEGWEIIAEQYQKNGVSYIKPTKELFYSDGYPSYGLLYSVTPFGKGWPIDELTPQFKEFYSMNDDFCIYHIFDYNFNQKEWLPSERINIWKHMSFAGCYYDTYYNSFLTTYDTTYWINNKFRYDIIENPLIINEDIFIKKDGQYINAQGQEEYIKQNKNNASFHYYKRNRNIIDLAQKGEELLLNLGQVDKFIIGNGLMAELTFQLEIIDYYTEENDPIVAQKKKTYLDLAEFIRNFSQVFEILEDADTKCEKYGALSKGYDRIIEGNKDTLSTINKLTLFALLNTGKNRISYNTLYSFYQSETSEGIQNALDILCQRGHSSYDFFEVLNAVTQDLSDKNSKRNIIGKLYLSPDTYYTLQILDSIEITDLYKIINGEEIEGLSEKISKILNIIDELTEQIKTLEAEKLELEQEFFNAHKAAEDKVEAYNKKYRYFMIYALLIRFLEINNGENNTKYSLRQIYNHYLEQMAMFDPDKTEDEKNKYTQSIYKYLGEAFNLCSKLISDNNIYKTIKKEGTEDPELDAYLDKYISENIIKIAALKYQIKMAKNILENEKYNQYIENKDNYILPEINDEEFLSELNNEITKFLNDCEPEKTQKDLEAIVGASAKIDFKINYISKVDWLADALNYRNINTLDNNYPKYRILQNQYISNLVEENIPLTFRMVLPKKQNTSDYTTGWIENDIIFLSDNSTERYKRLVILVDALGRILREKLTDDYDESKPLGSSENPKFENSDIDQAIQTYYNDYIGKAYNLQSLIAFARDAKEKLENCLKYITDGYCKIIYDKYENDFNWNAMVNAEYFNVMGYDKPEDLSPYRKNAKINFSLPFIPENAEQIKNWETPPVGSSQEILNKIAEIVSEIPYWEKFDYILFNYLGYWEEKIKTGLFYWGIDIKYNDTIKKLKDIVNQSKKLYYGDKDQNLIGYENRLNNYNNKLKYYNEQYKIYQEIFQAYTSTNYYQYYMSSDGDKYAEVDKKIAEVKNAWYDFILELDLGYKREVERGMYG